jgi:hypothetical protein
MIHPMLQSLIPIKAVQFVDMNEQISAFNRTYSKNLTKITEVEQKLSYIRNQIEHSTIKIPEQLQCTEAVSIVNVE